MPRKSKNCKEDNKRKVDIQRTLNSSLKKTARNVDNDRKKQVLSQVSIENNEKFCNYLVLNNTSQKEKKVSVKIHIDKYKKGDVKFDDIEMKIFEDTSRMVGSSKLKSNNSQKNLCHASSKEIQEIDSATNKHINIKKSKNVVKVASPIHKTKKDILDNIKVSKKNVSDKLKANEAGLSEISKSKELKKKVLSKQEINKDKMVSGIDNNKMAKQLRNNNGKLFKDSKTRKGTGLKTNEEKVNKIQRTSKQKVSNVLIANGEKGSDVLQNELQKTADRPRLTKLVKRSNLSKADNKQETPSSSNRKKISKCTKQNIRSQSVSDNFRAVEDLEEILSAQNVETETVQIELESTNVMWGMTKRRKKSHQELVEEYMRKCFNRSLKEVQENMHKTHILCLIAHGRYVNMMINSEEIMAASLSIIKNKNMYPDKRLNIGHMELVIKWYRKNVEVIEIKPKSNELLPLKQLLLKGFQTKQAHSKEEFTLMFLALLRVLGINGRLVFNIIPLSWKISTEMLIRPQISHESTSQKMASTSKISPSNKLCSQKKFLSDSDFSDNNEVKPTKRKKLQKKLVSSRETKERTNKYLRYWIEVFTEEEEQWMSLDIISGEMHHSSEEFEKKIQPQSGYILAYNNNLTFKDVTKRYVHNWCSRKNKVRFDHNWWEKSISNFRGSFTTRDDEEDKDLDQVLERQPLPNSFSSYKNHSLYVLQRHLLKFEAIYPPNVSPVGYFKGEPVFARECVKQLLGRDKWINQAKTIKVGEEPYKVVKARPKWDRAKCQMIKDLPLEVFGEWQVEEYEPPVAANGKVPRNEYGNVELFKPSMLPKGCVHINVPGINKLARKLGIDCAPALTGFNFNGGWSHPVYEGYVICEELKDSLMDAWREYQVEMVKRENEKRLSEIYGNWKKLIKGLMIKERIQKKYGDVLQKEANEIKAKKIKERKTVRKIIQKEMESTTVPQRNPRILKIDLESSAVALGRKRARSDVMKKELDDSSEEEATVEEKQEKIRTILNWKPSLSQNPNLSDSDEEMETSLNHKYHSPILAAKKQMLTPHLSESSSSEDFEIPKKRMKRCRSRVHYKGDSDPDDVFTDSGDDKTYQPDKNKR